MTRASDLAKLLTGGRTIGGTGEIIVKDIDTADGSSPKITLQTGDTDIASADVLGTIDFQAPDEGTGTDAILVAAGIEAVSEGNFSSSSNATSLVFKTGSSEAATEKVRLDSSGNLSIGNGANTNDGAIHINAGSSAKNIVLEADRDSDGQGIGNIQFHSAGTLVAQVSGQRGTADDGGQLTFYTATGGTLSDSIRIKQDGSVNIVNQASPLNLGRNESSGSVTCISFNNNSTSTTSLSGQCFRIMGDGDVRNTNNSYGSTSDIKLKENIVDASSQWDDIKALKVKNFSYKKDKLDKANMIGVIAQDVEASGMGGLITERFDYEGGEQLKTTSKAVKYSVLYMKAVKALQEAMTRIETLEAEVTKLKG